MTDPLATDGVTAAPVAAHPAQRAQIRLPAALSFLAGVTDVTSWLLLGGLFSAHITGNLVVLAADTVTHTAPQLAAVLALPAFVVTTVGATAVARRFATRHDRTRRARRARGRDRRAPAGGVHAARRAHPPGFRNRRDRRLGRPR